MEITKEIILENIEAPNVLEDLYQSDKKAFSEIIKTMHNDDSVLIIKYWYTRLFYKSPNKKGNIKKYIFTAFLIVLTWIPIRLLIAEDNYYANIYFYLKKAVPIIFFMTLSMFFVFNFMKLKNVLLSIIPGVVFYGYYILLLRFILLRPLANINNIITSQSINNAYYFIFVLLWFFILFSQSNYNFKKLNYTIFLEKCGETIVWSTIFIIGGAVIVGLSLALFNAIGIDAKDFYFKNIIALGLAAAPFVSLLVIENNSRIKLSVIIANIFLPIILVSLVAFGIVSIFTETKPYEDRDIFITYNIMIVLVICILIFTSINGIKNKFINVCSYILPVVTIILDIITLSAVIYRLNKYGITANKITLLGTNIVMLGHLVFMVYLKFRQKIEKNIIWECLKTLVLSCFSTLMVKLHLRNSLYDKEPQKNQPVVLEVTTYLPLYFVWAFVVVFIFPFVFRGA
ncbi:MAG: DUF4153 domain-containing protein [Treponema sp.]|jgi:hypothetical protein|nr:DUF4153 domain-containing protein [Treponema sp.]